MFPNLENSSKLKLSRIQRLNRLELGRIAPKIYAVH